MDTFQGHHEEEPQERINFITISIINKPPKIISPIMYEISVVPMEAQTGYLGNTGWDSHRQRLIGT